MHHGKPGKPRVLLITHSYWPEQSPPQRRWQVFIKSLVRHGYDVSVMSQGVAGRPAEEQGPHGERILRTHFTHKGQQSRWLRLVGNVAHSIELLPLVRRIGRADLVITTVPALPNMVAGYVLSRLLSTPLVVEMRDAWPDLLTEARVGGQALSRSATEVITTVQKAADLVMTVTEGFATVLRDRGLNNVVSIRNGVSELDSALLPQRSREADNLHVLYLGNHGESQNLGLMIRAAAVAREQNPEIRFRMVGSGTQKQSLVTLNQRLGEPVEMLDACPAEEARQHYRWADTCVVSLRSDWDSFRYTVPSKLYELLATGKHITGVLRGEAADILRQAGQSPIDASTPEQLAEYWVNLAHDPRQTPQYVTSHQWVQDNVSMDALSERLVGTVEQVINDQQALVSTRRQQSHIDEQRGTARLLKNVRLIVQTGLAHIDRGPSAFALLLANRLSPRWTEPLAKLASRLHGGPLEVVSATASAARGQTEAVRDELYRAVEYRQNNKKILALVRILTSLGETSEAEWGLSQVRPGGSGYWLTAARLEWHKGNVAQAISMLSTTGHQGKLRAYYLQQQHLLEGAKPSLKAPDLYQPEPGRVLHVLTNSLPHTGSGYAQRSHAMLLALKERGWDVSAVTRLGWPVITGGLLADLDDVVDGIRYRRLLPQRMSQDAVQAQQDYAQMLLEYALELRPALLHTTTHWTNANVVRAVAEVLNIPWVYEVRGMLADTWASTRDRSAMESDYYGLFTDREAEAASASDGLVTLGTQMKNRLEMLGVDTDRVVLSPNAIRGQFLCPPSSTQKARETLGFDPKWDIIGTVSSLVPYEGLDTVLRVARILRADHPTLRVLLVGDGTARPGLLRLAEQLGVADIVIAPGRVPREQAVLYHQAMDIFLVPRLDTSVTRTVTPMKSVEASASGKPVVASDLPALAELVDHGVTGILVPANNSRAWAEALERLLDSPEQRQAMGEAGRAWALKERTWAANEAKYTSLYKRLLTASRQDWRFEVRTTRRSIL
ncbi:glycosyltransferase family 4 protein [Auritidibacter ignavus]|uniref:glycosyltransferase family 4 protein n=1 Tax=Auritidibacter ignavus TaxID=678932 RepID=UPI00109CFB71|nr:glycosyltransferase [Auritidibacter ignavus]